MKIIIAILSTVIIGLFIWIVVIKEEPPVIENWPEIEYVPSYKKIANDAIAEYKRQGRDYYSHIQAYDPFGDYLKYGEIRNYRESRKVTFDGNGVPKVKYGEEFQYNPVTVSQYALTRYGQYILGNKESRNLFISAVDKLLEMQDEVGAFRYDFEWEYYLTKETYKPGWVSGMAQGLALSVFARAYNLTKDGRYLAAGNKTVDFLVTPIEDGGTMSNLKDLDPSLTDYIFFEEYISKPHNYTLNGFMFTLLGLYDWKALNDKYKFDKEKVAEEYFESGVESLAKVLPYYDIDGFSAYDLGHLTFDVRPHIGIGYHGVHIYLLHVLHELTGVRELQVFENIWRYSVE